MGAIRSVSLSLSYVRWPNPSVISSHRPGTSGKPGLSGGLGGRDQGKAHFFLENRIANCGENGVKLDSSWWFQIPKNRLFLERRMVPLGASGPKPPWCVFLGQILADPSNPTAISYNQLLASGAFHAVVKTLLRQSSWIPESLLSVISRVFEPGRRH